MEHTKEPWAYHEPTDRKCCLNSCENQVAEPPLIKIADELATMGFCSSACRDAWEKELED